MDQSQRTMVLRGYVVKEGDQWVATCLELTLAAQADSPHEALAKLFAIIDDYVREALGEDRMYADQLLSRRAPWTEYAYYYYLRGVSRIHQLLFKNGGDDNRPSDSPPYSDHQPFKRPYQLAA